MTRISLIDINQVLGGVDEIVGLELARTEATLLELRRAARLARRSTAVKRSIDNVLTPRMRRLLDLCSVAVRPAGASIQGKRDHADAV